MPAIPFFSVAVNVPQMPQAPLQAPADSSQMLDSAGDFSQLLQQEVDAGESFFPLPVTPLTPQFSGNRGAVLPPWGQANAPADETELDLDSSAAPDPLAMAAQVVMPYAPLPPAMDTQLTDASQETPPELQLLQQQRQWQPVLQSRQPAEKSSSLTPWLTEGDEATQGAMFSDMPAPEGSELNPLNRPMPLASLPAADEGTELPQGMLPVTEQDADDLANMALPVADEEDADNASDTNTPGLLAEGADDKGVLEQSLDSPFAEGMPEHMAEHGSEGPELRMEHAVHLTKAEHARQQTQLSNQASQNTQGTQFNSPLTAAPQDENFSGQISERLVLMVKGDVQSARIQLDPPELGALEVKIKIQHEQMTVTFNSGNAMVRDALEGQGNKLRDMLAQQGLTLSDLQVGSQSSGQQQGQAAFAGQNNSQGQGSGDGFAGSQGDGDEIDNSMPLNIPVTGRNNGIDHFA
ncbi:MAG: flagellar hook-length control protein FliK [Oceanospirillaceae bacterium]|nr:flagellar hook-length control protein FliK [Oceanospirillaceae bacterium]MCP5350071.1 flagellar hook-length control protein FliK [Oceanospirillaceae bacterium]